MNNGALSGVKVLDVSTLFAAPFAARMLADHGADVLKIEHPSGDPLRRFGRQVGDVGVTWKVLNRNKASRIVDLHTDEGQKQLRCLAADADIMFENFRPGVLSGWGVGWPELSALNPRLIMVSLTAYGQTGPYSTRPGFGTIAEAMSGLASISGDEITGPMLPSFPLGDAVAGMHAAFAALAALHARDRTQVGQHADVAILDSLIDSMGAQTSTYALTGEQPTRSGNASGNNAPRNVYSCRDGGFVALSAPSTDVAIRVLTAVGASELTEQEWFTTGSGRAQHRDSIDAAISRWTSTRTATEVVDTLSSSRAAVGPIYTIADLMDDEHLQQRGSIVTVDDAELGSIVMPNTAIRFSQTPGSIRHAGPAMPAR